MYPCLNDEDVHRFQQPVQCVMVCICLITDFNNLYGSTTRHGLYLCFAKKILKCCWVSFEPRQPVYALSDWSCPPHQSRLFSFSLTKFRQFQICSWFTICRYERELEQWVLKKDIKWVEMYQHTTVLLLMIESCIFFLDYLNVNNIYKLIYER